MAHATPLWAGCNLKTLTSPAPSRRQHRGHRRPPPKVGCASSGLPLPRLHRALVMPTESIRGRAHWAGVPGGPPCPPLYSKNRSLVSNWGSPMRHSLTPTAQDPDASAFAGEPRFRGLSGDREAPGTPWLSSPSLQDAPLETSLGVAEGTAGGPEGSGRAGAAQRPGPTGQEPCGQKPVCGAAVTCGGSSRWGEGGGSVRVSVLPGTGTHSSVVRGESGWSWVRDPCPSLSGERKLGRKM